MQQSRIDIRLRQYQALVGVAESVAAHRDLSSLLEDLKKRLTEAMAALTGYHWPGNVRELEHFIERAVVLTQGPDLEVSISELKSVAPTAQANISTLEAAEREHIMRALEEANWVVGGTNGAAARLGMKRTTLQSRMQKLRLERGKS